MVTKDRPRLFEQTIRSLYVNTQTPFSLTVVDDCSEDIKPVIDLAVEYDFQLIRNLMPTPLGESKNKAIRKLSPGLIYLTDNDVFFKPLWLNSLLLAWSHRPDSVALLGGGCHQWLGTNRIESREWYAYHYKDAISGWSWLLERSTWERFGPLDGNALGSGQSEDWAFCQRIKAGGYEVASIWPEVVVHCGRTNTEGKPAIGAETIRDVDGVLVE